MAKRLGWLVFECLWLVSFGYVCACCVVGEPWWAKFVAAFLFGVVFSYYRRKAELEAEDRCVDALQAKLQMIAKRLNQGTCGDDEAERLGAQRAVLVNSICDIRGNNG